MRAAGSRGAPLWFKAARVLLGAGRDPVFLDQPWIGPLLACAPRRRREALAVRLLALSPHYFVYQWSGRYPAELPRAEVLRRERERMSQSRRRMAESLVRPRVVDSDTLLDFGCGAGFLSYAVAPFVARVIGTDVARGAVACAAVINGRPTIEYRVNAPDGRIPGLAAESVDVVCCFAVFQHLERPRAAVVLGEMHRILKPGGTGVLHFAIGEPAGDAATCKSFRARRHLRYDRYSEQETRDMLEGAGFAIERLAPAAAFDADLDDDPGRRHLAADDPGRRHLAADDINRQHLAIVRAK